MIRFWVPGHPRTKGSYRSQGRKGRLVRSDTDATGRSESERWAGLVTAAARVEWARVCPWGPVAPIAGPVAVTLAFWLPAEDVTAGRPGDIDKLERNVLDALTQAKVYEDDVQVVQLLGAKFAADRRNPMGCLISVEPASGTAYGFSITAAEIRRARGLQV